MTSPTATTRLFGVLGHPVAHSRSPQLHNAAFSALGIDACYLAFDVTPEALPAAIAGLGAIGAVGANVTVPHKQAALLACDDLTDEARLIGAVNTLHWTAGGLVGDNTDARGFVASLGELGDLAGRRVSVLGAGGAARAAVVGLGRAGAFVAVAARRGDAARDLADLAVTAGAAGAASRSLEPAPLDDWLEDVEVVVNATPLGMAGERLPDPWHRLRSDQVAVDLVYTPPSTPFLQDAAAAGARAINGWGMLVHQAAAALRRWTGRDGLAAMQGVAPD